MSFLQRNQQAAREHFVVTHFDAHQDGTLASTERVVYEQHLTECQECRAWLQRQENLLARLELEKEPAVALERAAAARIQQDLYHAMRRAVIMNNIRASVAGVAALVVVVVGIGVVLWWQSGGLTSDEQESAPLQAPLVEEPAPAEDEPPLAASKAQELDDLLKAFLENGLFRGSALVARGDEIILSAGYGLADAEQETANTPQTRFRIGQMSQAFTAVAIMQLQEQGKLTLDDPICQYLDTCPAAWEPLTVNHLLFHSSGIADFVYEGGQLEGSSTPEQLIDRVIDLPLEIEPGSDNRFSNSDFVLLAMIIERIAGQPYLTFLQENIFDPLKMAGSGVEAAAGELAVGYSHGATAAGDIELSALFGTASLYATVEDLYRFSQALHGGQLLSQASYDQMFTSHFSPYSQYPDFYPCSAAWGCGSVDGRQLFYTTGVEASGRNPVEGFKSALVFYPDDDLTVILLENLDTADAISIAGAVAERVLAE